MSLSKSTQFPVFDLKICTACNMCASVCPTGAIDLAIKNSSNGFRRYPVLADAKKCISCGACEQECPFGAISLTLPAAA